MRIFLFLNNIVNICSFVLRDTNNFLSKDSSDYKIEINIDDDDYEMIDKKQLEALSVNSEDFRKLDELARVKYTKRTTLKPDVRSYKHILIGITKSIVVVNDTDHVISVTNLIWKYFVSYECGEVIYQTTRAAVITLSDNKIMLFLLKSTLTLVWPPRTYYTQKRKITIEKEYEYNYNSLLNEYYDQGDQEATWEDVSDTKEHYDIGNIFKNIFLSQQNTDYSNNSIGLKAIKCLIKEYTTQQRPTKDVAAWLWTIVQIWFILYLIVAAPLWCTRGWCCCCLFCKFFKPLETIDEAKKYLITNPPGIFRTKIGEVIYHPTQREKEAYEEFEHFIKTL